MKNLYNKQIPIAWCTYQFKLMENMYNDAIQINEGWLKSIIEECAKRKTTYLMANTKVKCPDYMIKGFLVQLSNFLRVHFQQMWDQCKILQTAQSGTTISERRDHYNRIEINLHHNWVWGTSEAPKILEGWRYGDQHRWPVDW